MRVDITIDHINPHERIAERQLRAAADKWTKKNWGLPLNRCSYMGMAWTIQTHAEFARSKTGLHCSVHIPGKEMVTICLSEK